MSITGVKESVVVTSSSQEGTMLGGKIEKIRLQLGMSQTDLGRLLKTSAMSVSRWERGVNPPSSRELLKLGLVAKRVGVDGWEFWNLAGVTKECAREMLDGKRG
jgi:DNA-binding transcriptional regulator YiaG